MAREDDKGLPRREFVKLCLAAMTFGPRSLAYAVPDDAVVHEYQRARLVNWHGDPIRVADLRIGENYIFHYPYVSTPCLLVNIGEPVPGGQTLTTEDGRRYEFPGGVGPGHCFVAFSAICAHRMSHPARQISYINYRHEPVRFVDKQEVVEEKGRLIYCCSENSVYDVRRGGRVLGGPAPQPLAAITLEYDDDTDGLCALGTCGGEMFNKFLTKFRERLELEYLDTPIDQLVGDRTPLVPLSEFTRQQVLCSG